MLEYMEKIVRDDAKFAKVMVSLTAAVLVLCGTMITIIVTH
ncbi:hypothetical protein [Massilia sp. METH4]